MLEASRERDMRMKGPRVGERARGYRIKGRKERVERGGGAEGSRRRSAHPPPSGPPLSALLVLQTMLHIVSIMNAGIGTCVPRVPSQF